MLTATNHLEGETRRNGGTVATKLFTGVIHSVLSYEIKAHALLFDQARVDASGSGKHSSLQANVFVTAVKSF
jgi:hypothetical protein